MKNYFIQNTKTGEILYETDREQEAEVVLETFEKVDKMNNEFVPELYVVRDMERIIDDNNDLMIKENYCAY